MLYNVLLYLRCSAETDKINLMVFLFMLYYVVEPKFIIIEPIRGNLNHGSTLLVHLVALHGPVFPLHVSDALFIRSCALQNIPGP